ncbi:MAG: NosD domain-containing protein, partial [Thermoplasmata archaeon]
INNAHGIDLSENSNSNILFNNTCSGNTYGIYLYSTQFNSIIFNNCTSNSLYGIYTEFSTDININNNTCSKNTNGIFTYFTLKAYINDNKCFENSFGLYLYVSDYSVVSYNNFSLNFNGVRLFNAKNNTITYNDFYKNTNYAIYIAIVSTDNIIHYNYFEQNKGAVKGTIGTSQAYDEDGNSWYNETEQKGNYWSNWDGNGFGTPSAYPIDGTAGAYDKYPTNPQAIPEFPSPLFVILCIAFISIAMLISRKRREKSKNE